VPNYLVDISVEYMNETEKAYQFLTPEGELIWLPKSQIEYSDGTCTLPRWLAEKKGLLND
jgi:hypothetical protein